MGCSRRWLWLALLAPLAACADDHASRDAAADGDSRGGGASGSSDASAASDAAPSSDAASISSDAGGALSSDAAGPSTDAGGGPSSDAGGSSSDAATALDAGKDGGASQDAAGSADTGAPSDTISCDPHKVLCDVVEPMCPENQVPSVKNGCFGPCVVIDQCSCSDAPECPHPETYVCHRSAHHCGPYVN